MRIIRIIAILLIGTPLIFTACVKPALSAPSTNTTNTVVPPSPPAQGNMEVLIPSRNFSPQKEGHPQINIAVFGSIDEDWRPITLSITAGNTVVWTNTGANPHSVISGEKLWDDKMLWPGESFNFTFNKPGTFTYFDEGFAAAGSIIVN